MKKSVRSPAALRASAMEMLDQATALGSIRDSKQMLHETSALVSPYFKKLSILLNASPNALGAMTRPPFSLTLS